MLPGTAAEEFQQDPGPDARDERSERALGRRAPPEEAGSERHERATSVTL